MAAGYDEATSALSRRLAASAAPGFVLAIPVTVGDCVEAIIELGRWHPFEDASDRRVMASVHAMVG